MAIIGSILGDIAGSKYEFRKPKDFDAYSCELFTDDCFFTDDTVLTVATKVAMLGDKDFARQYYDFARLYPNMSYGERFRDWFSGDAPRKPYESWGNGAAMRVSPIADLSKSVNDLLCNINCSVEHTHNHIHCYEGASCVALLEYLARTSKNMTKDEVLDFALTWYPSDDKENNYPVTTSMNWLRKRIHWSERCIDSVPVAIICVLNANSYEEFIRNVLSLDCDADTICCIGGGIAEELFGGTGFDNEKLLRKFLDDRLYNYVMM